MSSKHKRTATNQSVEHKRKKYKKNHFFQPQKWAHLNQATDNNTIGQIIKKRVRVHG